jgi:hypothetical protein
MALGNFEDDWEKYKYWTEGFFSGLILNKKNELTCVRINSRETYSELQVFNYQSADASKNDKDNKVLNIFRHLFKL